MIEYNASWGGPEFLSAYGRRSVSAFASADSVGCTETRGWARRPETDAVATC